MANANSTVIKNYQFHNIINRSDEFEFISIPLISNKKETKTYNSYFPIVMLEVVYDPVLGFECGKSIRLAPLSTLNKALKAAKVACISTPNAIGFTARGAENI